MVGLARLHLETKNIFDMQIRTFTIPMLGGEALIEEMNVFLRSKKVIQVKEHLINHPEEGVHWCFCVRYVDSVEVAERTQGTRVDYQKLLEPAVFQRFSILRNIRREVADKEAVKPFVVFTDAELAELAKMEVLTPENMLKIKGIGEKKLERYGQFFVQGPV
jgi:superfamily II DNA helicase RecQ